jgi:hypothetical protein
MKDTWSDLARETIAAVLSAYTAGGGDLIYLDSGSKTYLKKAIDAAYPFGERSKFPYKAWLIERRKVFLSLGIPVRYTARKPLEGNQLSLFSTSTKRKSPS